MPSPSSTAFDLFLKEIPHYQSFPAMLPFVGEGYNSAIHSKLMIVGESFYFPQKSTCHIDSSKWYSINQNSLKEEELPYIHCRGFLECNWKDNGHQVYRELNRCLVELGVTSQDRPVSHICFTNTFQRPATVPRESFRKCCANQDIVKSIDTLTGVIAILAPDLIIFASKFAWDTVGCCIEKQVSGSTFAFVSHPADPYHWNVKSYQHGRSKFISLLIENWLRREHEKDSEKAKSSIIEPN